MRTTIDIFGADQSHIGELTVGTDSVRTEDVLDREVVYFCADIFVLSTGDDIVHIDVNVPRDLLQQHLSALDKSTGTFTLPSVGDIEADEAFTIYDDDTLSLVIAWGMSAPWDMTVISFPAFFESSLLSGSQPFEALVLTRELNACLKGLFAAQQ
ncbi:MAG: hypothetical protein RI947_1279 [Candidatus Parcubacteria bacterium]